MTNASLIHKKTFKWNIHIFAVDLGAIWQILCTIDLQLIMVAFALPKYIYEYVKIPQRYDKYFYVSYNKFENVIRLRMMASTNSLKKEIPRTFRFYPWL